MAQTSVAQFASELKVPPSVLLEQLRAAGVEKKVPEDSLTDQDKSRLLEYLRRHDIERYRALVAELGLRK